jgi:hypothetical protein
MNKKLVLIGLVIVGCMVSSKSFADQDYRSRNALNCITDWTATIGKSPEEKQRIIDQRTDMRAKDREAWAHKRDEQRKIDGQKDDENKSYENHRSDLQNQYKDDPETLNKKLQDADNDHNAKMNDLDNQRKSLDQ